jgi:bleomycin hydrolase
MKQILFAVVFFLLFSGFLTAQEPTDRNEGFNFTDQVVLPATSVKDQNRTGTCWSFGGLAFLESEILRLKKQETDLSEMFIVYQAYLEKAEKYVRMHGNTNFGGGGSFHDVINVIRNYGIVPEDVYRGLNYGEDKHVHGEMDALLKDEVDAVIKNPNRKLSPVWKEPIIATLKSYLGEIPEKFEYQGKSYTPQSFARDFTGLNPDDYVEITSFSHHPFYSKFIMEIPDNWAWEEVCNVPLSELEEIIDYSLQKGFTVAWACDISEKGFLTGNKGVAMVPVKKAEEMTDSDRLRWEKLSDREKEEETNKFNKPVPELTITQEIRQMAFDNYSTTDDHGMLIVGTAADNNGNIFYKVKNSWGDYNKMNGFFYASKAYVKYKTTMIMVNKNAIPPRIRRSLNL